MIRFKTILCPTDFSETSARALTYAAAFARWYDADLEVLHVAPWFDENTGPAAGREPAGADSVHAPGSREGVIAEIKRALATAGATDVRAEPVVQEGRAPELIVYRAQALPADLLVMGTHGRSGFDRVLLGSITEKVLRRAPCPVLTVPPGAPPSSWAPVSLDRILCPFDYSPASSKALDYAFELGRQANGCVTVLHAVEYPDGLEALEGIPADLDRVRAQLVEHARRRLHAAVGDAADRACEVEEVVVSDRPYKAVLRHAKASNAELIVMGAQGTGGLELMVFGSNTQHVVRAAGCPVLTVTA